MGKITFRKLKDVLEANGKTYHSLRKDKVIGTASITKLQHDEGSIDTRTIVRLCEYLNCQPADFMEYITDDENA